MQGGDLVVELGAALVEAPARSEDLPSGLLEVLDFAPLVHEFYRRSGIDEQLVNYVRAYQAEGDRLRDPTTQMVKDLLNYLHTRPITSSQERVEIKNPDKKKKETKYEMREKERRFLILPDLLAPRGAINFRIIGDDYYAIVPPGMDLSDSDVRRAYLQFVLDPIILKNAKDILTFREGIKAFLEKRAPEFAGK